MDISDLQKQLAQSVEGTSGEAGGRVNNKGQEPNLPPVEKWDPPFCGDMNLVIKRNGQWWHEGTPFTRAKLVQLFASVIKKEANAYFLVTPVEKIGIQVEDVPFVVIDANETEQGISINTQTGDCVLISEEHPVELREFESTFVPYCHIRRNLWARVHQNVLYRWVDEATEHSVNGNTELTLQSGVYQFCIGRFTEG